MKVLLDEQWLELCVGCAGQGYWERAGTDLVIHMDPCPHCEGMGLQEHTCG